MYRWPVELLDGHEPIREESCIAEISPRGAAFSLAMLSYGGHQTHLSLIDAHIRGEVHVAGHNDHVGTLAYGVAASLIVPLAVAYAGNHAQITLRDWTLLPPQRSRDREGRAGTVGVWTEHQQTIWIRSSETFPESDDELERMPPLLRGGERPPWRVAMVGLPLGSFRHRRESLLSRSYANVILFLESQADSFLCPEVVSTALRRLAFARSAQVRAFFQLALDELLCVLDRHITERQRGWSRLRPIVRDVLNEAHQGFDLPRSMTDANMSEYTSSMLGEVRTIRSALLSDYYHDSLIADSVEQLGVVDPANLSPIIETNPNESERIGVMHYDGLVVDVAVAPEADGGATLSLLPPVEEEPTPELVGRMEAAAREVLALLMGVPFAEERKEEIAHRLVGPERTTTLLVGWSLVLPRNRRVFAAWLGSDGRVMIRLFPPEGRPARGRA